MKKSIPVIVFLAFAVVISSVGFQCSSTELTSAKLYIQRSEWDNAIKSLEGEVAKNPKNEEAWFLLGQVKAQKNDFAGMNDAFDKALGVGQTYVKEIHDMRFGYWGRSLNVGVENFNKARDTAQYYDKKIDSLRKTKSEANDREEIKSLERVKAQIVGEFYDKSIAGFNTAIAINPDSAAGYKNLGFTYLSKNETVKALTPLEKAFELSKDVVVARYIGEVNYDMGLRHKERFENGDNKTEVRILMSPEEVRAILGEPTGKSTTKDKKNPKEKWIYEPRKLVLNFETAQLKSWEEGGKKEEKAPNVFYKSYAERDSAMRYFDKAITVLERSRQLNPHKTELLAALSNVYTAAEKSEIACEIFKSGVETEPGNKVFHYNYGVCLLKLNDYEKATAQFLAAVTIDTAYESAIYNLGVAYVNWGVHLRESAADPAKVVTVYKEKFKLGLPYLEKLTRLKLDDIDAWELLGKVYANLGMSKDATAAFEKADKLRKPK